MPNSTGPVQQATSNACWDGQHIDCGLHAPDGGRCICSCHEANTTDQMLMPATHHTQNARQAAQDEASAVRSLTNRSTDYHRLPEALRSIVDAYSCLDSANDIMAYVRGGRGMRPEDAPNEQMVRELSGLVEHTLHELRRHGVIEGALAWLASHPEGWDDEPERNYEAEAAEIRSEYRHEDDDRYQMSDAEAEYRASAEAYKAEHGEYPEQCDQGDDEGEAVRTPHCHGCKRQFQPGDLCEQWAHTQSPELPVRSLCADCSWPAESAKRLKRGGYALRIGYTIPADDQGDDPLTHGYPREWFTGQRS